AGVVPFLPGLALPEEDSVGLDRTARADAAGLEIAGVRLPHIATCTDFAPLETESGVRLVYARSPRELAGAVLVILPGSKDTIADLRALRMEGFAPAIAEHLRRGGHVLGVCGGYQMLGRAVSDPHGVESGGVEPGVGLLPVATVLASEKITRRVRARWLAGGRDFEGYEIHMGETTREGARPLLEIEGRAEGCVSPDGRVWGTYLHGLFEEGAPRRHVLQRARGAAAPAQSPATRAARTARPPPTCSTGRAAPPRRRRRPRPRPIIGGCERRPTTGWPTR